MGKIEKTRRSEEEMERKRSVTGRIPEDRKKNINRKWIKRARRRRREKI